MGGIGALTEDGEVRREGGRKPAARWNSSWRVPSSVPASAPGQLVRTPDSCEAEGPGRKSGLAPTCTVYLGQSQLLQEAGPQRAKILHLLP